uniref:BTB/POZ domain containing protein, putative n=1 Tax=Theileria annulata TaxID=5874 RepID=A0A3B0MYH4_THEAN
MYTPKKTKAEDGFYPRSQYEFGSSSQLDSNSFNCMTQNSNDETTFYTQADKRVILNKNLVNFNVGGVKYTTTMSTLSNDANSKLYKYAYFTINGIETQDKEYNFDGFFNFTDSNSGGVANIFIDRDGKIFQYILNYLRDGDVICPDDPFVYQSILSDAKFYMLRGLVEAVSRIINKQDVLPEPKLNIPEPIHEVEELSSQKTQFEFCDSIPLTQHTNCDVYLPPHNVFLRIEENDNIEESIQFVQTTPVRLLGEQTFSTTADF